MLVVIPWQRLINMIKPYYFNISDKGGRPPFDLGLMLKIHCLQQ